MSNKKRFAILSGPSCVGKGSLQEAVRRLYPKLIDARPILCTSRPPRVGEVHGEDYYFLPATFIQSLDKSPDFVVSPVRSDWQAIHLQQIEDLLSSNNLVFAEVYYTFGPALLKRAVSRQFETVRIFLLPLPSTTPPGQVIEVMSAKLTRRATDPQERIYDRASSAPKEIEAANSYTHLLINPAGEDDIAEWKSFGTCGGEKGKGKVNSIEDLGPNAQWLVKTFVKILNGELAPGEYSKDSTKHLA